ncbi:unnamed protein product [Ectocarpus sp. 4 AP-2014]
MVNSTDDRSEAWQPPNLTTIQPIQPHGQPAVRSVCTQDALPRNARLSSPSTPGEGTSTGRTPKKQECFPPQPTRSATLAATSVCVLSTSIDRANRLTKENTSVAAGKIKVPGRYPKQHPVCACSSTLVLVSTPFVPLSRGRIGNGIVSSIILFVSVLPASWPPAEGAAQPPSRCDAPAANIPFVSRPPLPSGTSE